MGRLILIFGNICLSVGYVEQVPGGALMESATWELALRWIEEHDLVLSLEMSSWALVYGNVVSCSFVHSFFNFWDNLELMIIQDDVRLFL